MADAGRVSAIADGAPDFTFVTGDIIESGLDATRESFRRTYTTIKGQAAEQQAKDEQACYDWALGQSGIDPTKKVGTEAAGKQAKGQVAEATSGATVVGAAGGAIAGDAGTGAVAGAVRGRRARKTAERQAEAQGEKQAAAYNQRQLDTFKKAVSACLEGRGYTVK